MKGLTTNVSSCDLTGKFSISGDVEFSNAPASGVLTVKDVTAIPPVSVDLLPPFVSPYPYTLPGINCDGSTQTITATFSNEPTCTRSETVVAPGGCPFAAMTISGDGHICNDGVSKDTLFITFSGGPPPYNFTYDIDGGIEISVTN